MPSHTDRTRRRKDSESPRAQRGRSGASEIPVTITLQPGSSATVTQNGHPPVELRATGRGGNSGLMRYDKSSTARWVDAQNVDDRRHGVDTGAKSSSAYTGISPHTPTYSGYSADTDEEQRQIDYQPPNLLMPPSTFSNNNSDQNASAPAPSTATHAPYFIHPAVYVQDHTAQTFPPVGNAPSSPLICRIRGLPGRTC
jgi:hypothetical protein